MIVEVTADDIRLGDRTPTGCAVALAFKRALAGHPGGPPYEVGVSLTQATAEGPRSMDTWDLPEQAVRFIGRVRDRLPLSPISFEVPEREALTRL